MEVKNFKTLLVTSLLPIIYGFIAISIMRTLSNFGALLIPVVFGVAFVKCYIMYNVKTIKFPILIGIYFGEVILLTMSYVIPFEISSFLYLAIYISSFVTGLIFRSYAKKIA